MKNKKCLEIHSSEGLRKLIIKNAKTKSEIKTNIALNEILKRIPGQEKNFIAGNGHILSKTNHKTNLYNHRLQNPQPPFNLRLRNTNHQAPEFNLNFPPPGLTQTHTAAPPQLHNVVLSQAQHGMFKTQPQHVGPAQQQHVAAAHAQTQQSLTQPHLNIPAQYQVAHAHAQPKPQAIFQPPVQTSYFVQTPQSVVTNQSVPGTVDTTDFDFSENSDQQQQKVNINPQGVGHQPSVDNPEPNVGPPA